MIIFKDSESLGFLGLFFYVILKLSIVRREKRMKKSKNLKGKIGAVMLSLVLAVSTVFTTTAVSEKKVSAQAEIKVKDQLQRWTVATKLLPDSEKYYDQSKSDKKINDKTAAIYTAIEYIWNEDENKVSVGVFCDSVRKYFAGCDDFNAEKLAAIGQNDYFEYNSGDDYVTLKTVAGGRTQECTYIGENENSDGSKTMYGVWTDPDPAPGDPATPYYVALDIAENGQMTAYRKLEDGSQLNVDIYEFNEDGAYVRSYTTSSGKAFIPDGKEAGFSYSIQIRDKEKSETSIEFTDRTLDGNSFNLNLESEDTSIVDTDYDRVTAKYKKGTTNIKYNLRSAESGNVIYSGSIPSTVYSISIGGENYYGIYLLPGESRQVTANIEGYDGPVSYQWISAECKIDNPLGNTCKITAPSKEGNPKILVQAFIKEGESEEPIGVKEEEITVTDCKLSFSYRKFVGDHSEAASGDTLKVGEAYWFSLDGASFAWDYGNGNRDDSKRQTFYTMDFELNGKHLIATDTEENLGNDELSLSIGAGGGFPNRIITPKKAGTLTITGTIYRNGQFFRDVRQTYKVEGNTPSPTPSQPTPSVNKPTTPIKVTVKKTTLKSAKNAKGKKIVVKWKKNTAGNGYQIQYSTSKKFAKGNKTKTISKNKTTSYTIKKLKKKKTYYVRIRTYKKVSGKTYYSGWSSVKKVKIKK